MSLGATPPSPRRRSENEGVERVPSLLPADPRVRLTAFALILALLTVVILVLVLVNHYETPAIDRYRSNWAGGNSGVAPATYDDEPGQGTYSPPDEQETTPAIGDTATDADGYGGVSEPTTSSSAPTPSPGATDPASVVEAYFAAINDQDYQTAWDLGGENLDESYSDFTAGFANTQEDTVSIESVAGDVATATLVAQNDDGTVQDFSGAYTVTNGVITRFQVH